MSLLKALQQRLTCVSVPWVPVGNATTCYLINEIVTGEESDEDERGGRASHFKLYLRAMKQAGSDTGTILALLENLEKGATIQQALTISDIPITTAAFVRHTFDVTADGRPHMLAAVFPLGGTTSFPPPLAKVITNRSFPFLYPNRYGTG